LPDGLPKTPSASVLVVDDNQAMQQLMSYVLRGAGHHVLTARNGLEALDLLSNHPGLRLIITDLDMPILDGFGLLRQLRLRRGPPVLIITARGQKTNVEQALELGVAGVLEKPFSRRELLLAATPFLSVP